MTVGRGNRYHHPADEVVSRYANSGSGIYRTDRDGAIVLAADEGVLTAVAWNERELIRIGRAGRASVWEQEQENWKRMYLRRWGL